MLWVSVNNVYEKWDEYGIAKVRIDELPEGEIAYSPEDFWRQLAKMPMADFRLSLLANGFLEQVETAMASSEMPQEAKIFWEYATTVNRNDPILNQVNAQLGFTDEDLDLVFGILSSLGGATTEQRDAWATLAEDYHAPAELVAAIRGT